MCDVCGSSLMFVALTMCAASVYQMMRGIIVIITALLAMIFLGKKQYAHHWLSLFMIVAGLAIVGVSAITDEGSSEETKPLGIILLLFS
jgi:drug/metabolite transporter (DMT)-like permease